MSKQAKHPAHPALGGNGLLRIAKLGKRRDKMIPKDDFQESIIILFYI